VCATIDEVAEFVAYFGEHRHDVEHEIDGIVVKVDELACTTSSAPRAVRRAGRSPTSTRQVQTKLLDIVVSWAAPAAPRRSPSWHPPTSPACRAPGDAAQQDVVKAKGVLIGDTVVLRKAGDVIPRCSGRWSSGATAPSASS
jgi:DNA ligase (NAD+)